MTHDFDKNYWEEHWGRTDVHRASVNPYIVDETRHLPRGTALDAGCGTGAEAIWLAEQGWTVTGADISTVALADAAAQPTSAAITWVETDLTTWAPQQTWDLVITNYAHPSIPQLAFYRHIADWVAPGGTLIIVGHLHGAHNHGGDVHGEDGHQPPEEATVRVADIEADLVGPTWHVDTAAEHSRSVTAPDGRVMPLRDVVVRATRSR